MIGNILLIYQKLHCQYVYTHIRFRLSASFSRQALFAIGLKVFLFRRALICC